MWLIFTALVTPFEVAVLPQQGVHDPLFCARPQLDPTAVAMHGADSSTAGVQIPAPSQPPPPFTIG